MKLSAMEIDALKEIANIGVSSSATQLSQLLNDEIKLEVPDIDLTTIEEMPAFIEKNSEQDLGIVVQKLSGELNGNAHLVFFADDTKVLVQTLLGCTPAIEDVDMGFFEREAITEIGNIVISSFITQFANQLGGEIKLTVPSYSEKNYQEMINQTSDKTMQVLTIKTSITASKRNVRGFLVIMLTLESTVKLIDNLTRYINVNQEKI